MVSELLIKRCTMLFWSMTLGLLRFRNANFGVSDNLLQQSHIAYFEIAHKIFYILVWDAIHSSFSYHMYRKSTFLCATSKLSTHFWNKGKYSNELIDFIVGQAVVKLWIKAVKILVSSYLKNCLASLDFNVIFKFLGQLQQVIKMKIWGQMITLVSENILFLFLFFILHRLPPVDNVL